MEKRNNIPDFLHSKLINQYGADIAEQILTGYTKKRKSSLRVNRLKSDAETIASILSQKGIDFKIPQFNSDAFLLNDATEEQIKVLDIYLNGEIYLQSLSSMLPPIVLSPNTGEDILDMAAAPGGKTTQIASITLSKSHITACERHPLRAEKLKYNLQKQGVKNVNVMVTDARNLESFFAFDKILLDAPCSGSGTLYSGNVQNSKFFTQTLIEKSVKTQTTLLKKALSLLKTGGTVVYSTCSVLKEENEDVVKTACKGFKTEILPINFEGNDTLPTLPCSIDGAVCICPNEEYEGFFIAKIKKL